MFKTYEAPPGMAGQFLTCSCCNRFFPVRAPKQTICENCFMAVNIWLGLRFLHRFLRSQKND